MYSSVIGFHMKRRDERTSIALKSHDSELCKLRDYRKIATAIPGGAEQAELHVVCSFG